MNIYLKNTITATFDKEFKFRETGLVKLGLLLKKNGVLDEKIWDRWIKRIVEIKRIRNIEDYHTMLQLLLWYNDNPKSPKFSMIEKDIDIFKNQIRNNPNRNWKYDPEVNFFLIILNRKPNSEPTRTYLKQEKISMKGTKSGFLRKS